MTSQQLTQWIHTHQTRVEEKLAHYLSLSHHNQYDKRLHDAMRYATLNGGKRLRALLLYASAEACQVNPEQFDETACAIEFIHAYSLIHDDMPIMDDDDLRRGKPACHKQFDEATALLAGDALQALAYQVLATSLIDNDMKVAIITRLSTASGANGMVAGQAIDIGATDKRLTLAELNTMHQLKTGALIQASIQMPDILNTNNTHAMLTDIGLAAGLAFQIQDDILDVIGNTTRLGKPVKADEALNKPTYPALLGIEAAQQYAQQYCDKARQLLATLPGNHHTLTALIDFIVQRQY